MLRNRRISLAWNAYLAELAAMQMTEHPSEAVIALPFQEYFRNRFIEAPAIASYFIRPLNTRT